MEHIDWTPRKWRSGTRGLTVEQKLVYFEICNEIYLLGEAIPEDLPWLAGIIGMKPRRLSARIEELIVLNKIRRIFGENLPKLIANHCEAELEACTSRIETARKNGKNGGRPPKNQQVNKTPSETKSETKSVYNKNQPYKFPPKSPENLREGEAAEPSPEAQAPDDPTPPIQTAAECDGTATDDPPPEVPSGDTLPPPSEPPGSAPGLAAVGEFLPPLTSTPARSARALGSNPRALGTNPRSRPPPAVPPSPAPTGPPELVAMFEALRAEIGEAAFRAWIAPLEVGAVNGAVTLHAPSRFHRDHVDGHWGDRMRTIIGCLVEIEVAAAERRG